MILIEDNKGSILIAFFAFLGVAITQVISYLVSKANRASEAAKVAATLASEAAKLAATLKAESERRREERKWDIQERHEEARLIELKLQEHQAALTEHGERVEAGLIEVRETTEKAISEANNFNTKLAATNRQVAKNASSVTIAADVVTHKADELIDLAKDTNALMREVVKKEDE